MSRMVPSSLLLVLAACASESTPAPEATPEPTPQAKEAPAPKGHPMQALFGDTHLHTGYSFDAGTFGATTSPDDAYRFAKGEKVTASKGLEAQLNTPLDFLVVADHSENLGWFFRLRDGDPFITNHPLGKKWHEGFKAGGESQGDTTLDIIQHFARGQFPEELQMDSEETRPVWEKVVDAAEAHNDPGNFTAFIGYEWTSNPTQKNLHRVVIFKDDAEKTKKVVPFSAQDSTDPEELWAAMSAYEEKTGGNVLAIAHNGNLSNGEMFSLTTRSGKALDADYAARRTLWEPLYEISQIKGDGEAHPFLSPDDEFADFETWDMGSLDAGEAKTNEMLPAEYGREALKRGIKQQHDGKGNPFKFGFIASTDSHTGLATADDDVFFGKHSGVEPSAERAQHVMMQGSAGAFYSWQMTGSGYAAVWAHENTRESIFEAMERKETYATTGPRISLRFFGGWDFSADDLKGDWIDAGYTRGVPMGGDLKAKSGEAPSFVVAASMDPKGAHLDRVQVVKGWVDAEGATHEKVYDVTWSDDRTPGEDGKLPAVGNTVNVDECTFENSIGSAELQTVWTDPAFNPAVEAFYYLRVLEIPTPRWTAWDKKRFGAEIPPEAPLVSQQRAYSSPIWYTPGS